jgi:hypothetical protein
MHYIMVGQLGKAQRYCYLQLLRVIYILFDALVEEDYGVVTEIKAEPEP